MAITMFRATIALFLLTVLSLPRATLAHIELVFPPGINSKYDPQTLEVNIDYSMTSPLLADGSNYPCKGYNTPENIAKLNPVATLTAGSQFGIKMAGTATHGGGSCQFSVSYDQGKTFAVIASVIGGCPIGLSYTIPIPANLPSGKKALFSWTWFNFTGNREMYQNCAVVDIAGKPGVTTYKGPVPYRANTFADGTCITEENVDIIFPNPGQTVFYGGGEKKGSSPVTKLDDCSYDEDEDVTISSSGGSTVSPNSKSLSSSSPTHKPTQSPSSVALPSARKPKTKSKKAPIHNTKSHPLVSATTLAKLVVPSPTQPATVGTDNDDKEYAEAQLICTSSTTFSLCSSPKQCTPMGIVAAGTICKDNAIIEDPNRFAKNAIGKKEKRGGEKNAFEDVRRSRSLVAHARKRLSSSFLT